MTDEERPVTLETIIRAELQRRGWDYATAAERSGGHISQGQWQQLANGIRMRTLPQPSTLVVLSEVLGVDVATLLLAAGRTVGLDV